MRKTTLIFLWSLLALELVSCLKIVKSHISNVETWESLCIKRETDVFGYS